MVRQQGAAPGCANDAPPREDKVSAPKRGIHNICMIQPCAYMAGAAERCANAAPPAAGATLAHRSAVTTELGGQNEIIVAHFVKTEKETTHQTRNKYKRSPKKNAR